MKKLQIQKDQRYFTLSINWESILHNFFFCLNWTHTTSRIALFIGLTFSPQMPSQNRSLAQNTVGSTSNAPLCPMGSNSNSSSSNTSHLIHRRRHQCPFCSYESNWSNNLRKHVMHRHTGEKPFHCSFCDWQFTQKISLLIHMKKRHQ